MLAAVPERGDPRDALVGGRARRPRARAPASPPARCGAGPSSPTSGPTSPSPGCAATWPPASPRRPSFDAIVVAAVALERLGLGRPHRRGARRRRCCCPRSARARSPSSAGPTTTRRARALAAIEHAPSRRAVDAERAFLAELGGDCDLPAGAYATVDAPTARCALDGLLASADGHVVLRHTTPAAPTPTPLGRGGRPPPRSTDGGAIAHAGGRRVTVYLVGAGPGDPGLLTVRGAEVLGRADVVVYDRLSVAVAARPGARRRRAHQRRQGARARGPTPGRDQRASSSSTAAPARDGRAAQGRRPVRVRPRRRGGAPRWPSAGVAFEVVPGITSAIAAPAYAGIPVTLRYSSTSFTVVTGHEDPRAGEGTVDWEAVARVGGTIVILMGVGAHRPRSPSGCSPAGCRPTRPAAAVTWGTRPEQRTVRATLADARRPAGRAARGDRRRATSPPRT